MEKNQKEETKKRINQLTEDIEHTKYFHEKIGYDIEYNLMKNKKVLESDTLSVKDREFFINQRQKILKIREREQEDFEEYTKKINKQIESHKEEIYEIERNEKKEDTEENHDND